MLVQSVNVRAVSWSSVCVVILLTSYGVACVNSACFDPTHSFGIGRESRLQLYWWAISIATSVAVAHITLNTWKTLAWPLYGMCVVVVLFMMAAAGSYLVPSIKGQANWIVLGPLRVQPVEFIKLGALLGCAKLMSNPGFDARLLSHTTAGLLTAAVPSALVARGDLGSALTFVPMVVGMLFVAGMRLRWLAVGGVVLAGMTLGLAVELPHDGYQYKRVQAWLHPDEYALTEGFQAQRSMSAIGSGQWLGKGYAVGDQNRLGMVPEHHTDLILAVAGEELGFVGTSLIMCLFVAFAWTGLASAARCRDPTGRMLITGYVCLVCGQASINLAVALGMMPVTGVTLPFFSYGGSSLLATYIGLGMTVSCCVAARHAHSTSRSGHFRGH